MGTSVYGKGKKGSSLAPIQVTYLLNQLSKAALLDMCWDFIERQHGSIDGQEACELLMKDYLPPVLRVRGDRMPDNKKAAQWAYETALKVAKLNDPLPGDELDISRQDQ
jgi:hypothetical protein